MLDGMPVPVTDTPAPMATMVVANVTNLEPDVNVPVAVNTPTGANDVPVNGPYKGRVLVVFVMYCRFCPGCAINCRFPPPVESYPMSNCQRLYAFGMNDELIENEVGPVPMAVTLLVTHCCTPQL